MRGLDVEYDGVQVLFGVDLDVAAGELVVLLGTNGSGKSTVLRAVSGLVRSRHGTITIEGHDVTRAAPERVAALGVGHAPGGEGVFPSLTVAEHLRLARWLVRDRQAADDDIADALERFPVLAARMREPAGNLSGGEQQLLTLTMALVARPHVLLVDELTLGLAPAVAESVVELLQRVRASGTTVLVVEQSLDLALRIADRAYFLEHGEIRFEGAPADLMERHDLVRAVFIGDTTATGTVQPVPPERPDVDARAPRLVVDGIGKHFGGVVALDAVSFAVGPGEIVGFVGANGAGKTTLFDVLSGFIPADAGTITLRPGDGPVDRPRPPPGVPARAPRRRPLVPGRPALPRAHRQRDDRGRARARRAGEGSRRRRAAPAGGGALGGRGRARVDELVGTPRARARTRTRSCTSSRPAPAASSTSRARSRTSRRCCSSTSRRAASRSAKPRRWRRSSSTCATRSGPVSS